MEGVKFLQKFGKTTREADSLNSQINSIQVVLQMLRREIQLSELETKQMVEVNDQEKKFLKQRNDQILENESAVSQDVNL